MGIAGFRLRYFGLTYVEVLFVKILMPFYDFVAALKQAIREGDIALVRGALAVPGLNPDTVDTASGMSLLTWAATYGQDDIVKLLLRRGAGINYFDPKRNAITALMQSAEQVGQFFG